ncbi:hypothetical protein HY251_20450 [bacterium]|nr:hypothetical protein [bacterium]
MAMTPERARELLPLVAAKDLDPETCAQVREICSHDAACKELLARHEALEKLLLAHAGEPRAEDPAWVKRLASPENGAGSLPRGAKAGIVLFMAIAAVSIGAFAGFHAGLNSRAAPRPPARTGTPPAPQAPGSPTAVPPEKTAPEREATPGEETPPRDDRPGENPAEIAKGEPVAPPIETPVPFVHLQTDKPAYRLGDTLWYRLHLAPGADALAVTVSLVREETRGKRVILGSRKHEAPRPLDGTFLIREDQGGGELKLVAECEGKVVHEVSFPVYDVVSRELDLTLAVLAETHDPGAEVVAVLGALDLAGRPLVGVRVRWRATFGSLEASGDAGPTDSDGRAVIRVAVPKEAQTGGFLSAGIEHEKKLAVVSQPIAVSAGVSRVDVFPEGGTIVLGTQRLGLLVRDQNGDPVIAEGRVLDDRGRCAAAWKTDRRGLATVTIDYEEGRRYEVKVDRPAGVSKRFALPGPTGHSHALRVLEGKDRLDVVVLGKKTTGRTELLLAVGERIVARAPVEIREDGGSETVSFPATQDFALARLVLREGDRATIQRPLVVGRQFATSVLVKPREGPHTPGEPVLVDLVASESGKPAQGELALSVFKSGVAEDARWEAPDLAARALLAPLVSGAVSSVGDLFLGSAGEDEMRDAYVLVLGSSSFPKEGVALRGTDDLPDARAWRMLAGKIEPRALPEPKGSQQGVTVARASGLDRMIERAPFVRTSVAASPSDETCFLSADEIAGAPLPGHGELASLPPQDVKLPSSRPDCRDALFWSPRLATDKEGRASATFKVGPVAPYSIVVQGWAGGRPVSRVERFTPRASFATSFAFPSHVSVGDRFSVVLSTDVRDASRETVDVAVHAPLCLKLLERAEVTSAPTSRVTKLEYEVVSPESEASFRVVVSRGLYREESTRTFSATYPELELSVGKSGVGSGAERLSVKVPEAATPGSLCARSRVVPPSPVAEALDGVERMLGEPNGCFEQTTAVNYPNLVVLERLKNTRSDGAVLERAHGLAASGFAKILKFQSWGGGFALWPNGEPDARSTAIGIMEVAQFAKLCHGRGSCELARALSWLERHEPADSLVSLYAAFAVTDAGFAWKGSARALHYPVKSSYEQALVANVLASWQGEWPEKEPRREMLATALASLEKEIGVDGRIWSEGQGVPAGHHGVMGSTGVALSVETTALAALAFEAAGKHSLAARCACGLSVMKGGRSGWPGTQATALSIHALARFLKDAESKALTEPAVVTMTAGANAPIAGTVSREREKPVVLLQAIEAKAGQSVELALDIRSPIPLEYGLACTYRVASPESSNSAPYKITTKLAPKASLGDTVLLDVAIEPRWPAPVGQVCAVLGIPGGLRPCIDDCRRLGGASQVEIKPSSLVLYWETGPAAVRFVVPLSAASAGTFSSQPSVVYPYYEAGMEAFAPGHSIEIAVEKTTRTKIDTGSNGQGGPDVPPMKPPKGTDPPPVPVGPGKNPGPATPPQNPPANPPQTPPGTPPTTPPEVPPHKPPPPHTPPHEPPHPATPGTPHTAK